MDYLHSRNVVHRDLKPENLLYLTRDPQSALVLADFGIARMIDRKDHVLNTMAGSFGYAAPEIMLRQGHGKPVDMWSLGVITYTLLCGYSPFRSESMQDLIEECRYGRIVFHERYWKDVSPDAKDFIKQLLNPDPSLRPTSSQALRHRWLTGTTATDHDLVGTLRSRRVRLRFKLGVQRVQLAQRIERLKQQENAAGIEDRDDDIPGDADSAADVALSSDAPKLLKGQLSRARKADIMRAVVLAASKEMKAKQEYDEEEQLAHATSRSSGR